MKISKSLPSNQRLVKDSGGGEGRSGGSEGTEWVTFVTERPGSRSQELKAGMTVRGITSVIQPYESTVSTKGH